MDAEGWNLTRFSKATVDPTKGHLESTFIKLNDPAGKRALWVKNTIFAPTERTSGGPPYERGRTVAEAWAVAFDRTPDDEPPTSYREVRPGQAPVTRHVAVKRTVPVEDAILSPERPYKISWAGVSFDGRRLEGRIEHGDAEIRFDLELSARDPSPLTLFPLDAMYEGRFPKTKAVSPIVDAVANGEVEVRRRDGRRRTWDVRDWPAMEGHNWGVGHADLYAWAHVNCWNEPEGRGLVLEGFSGKVKALGLTTPLITLIGVRHRGVRYEGRGLELLRMRGRIEGLRRWVFSAELSGASVEGELELAPDDTVGLYYPNPTGEMTYCLNSKIARARITFRAAGRAPLLVTSDAAALEIGTHEPRHGIRMYV